ncbi:nuclear transport factor 2 family protein [Archangium lansingense]|uniref:Nuclear transport factor 2 family protein n=1 Tax=Archangium lansingense TaxID=2995310 RepID=A0ABT4A579_9BACT|nr:nuclear transport factor 2 family protein [Archangium lansinium]MCY1076414.1 nuclear transport factor 2 family protein [Archangium lansinium]
MNVRPLLVCALLVLAACGPRNIPGTQIPDTNDSRAILNVMERYRAALEARDAKALQGLVSKSFRDNAGTEDPSDDFTYDNLSETLPALFSRIESAKVEMDIRKVEVRTNGVATVIYYWNATWRAPSLLDKPQRDSELEQMVLQKEEGQWRIVSGF